jgi:signal transduction histidine kinase
MKSRWSIRTYLWLLALAVAVPCAGVLIYSHATDASHEQREMEATTLSLAQLVAAQTQAFLEDSETIERILVQRRAIQAALDPSPDARPGILDQFLFLHPQYTNLLICNATGALLHSAVKLPEDYSADKFQGRWVEGVVRHGRFTVGRPIRGQITRRWVCVLGYPIQNESGEIAGALGMSVDLERIQRSASALSLPPNSSIAIVDQDGTVIAGSWESQNWIARPARGSAVVDHVLSHAQGNVTARDMDGVERIHGFTFLPHVGWHVYVGIPTEFAYATSRANALRAGLVATAVVGFIVLLVLLVGALINEPILVLSRAAITAAEGKLDTTVPLSGPKEIARVAEEFNHMVAVRHEKELEIKKLNADLEKRVQERTAELEKTNTALTARSKDLETANKELEAFCYSVSHDLRAPVRTIGGFTKVLIEGYSHQLDESGKDYLDRTGRAVERMTELIDDLLELSRISRSKLVCTEVDLTALAADVSKELKATAPERPITFDLEPGLVARGDAGLLRVLIENLLGNSWKFTRKHNAPRIEFGKEQSRGATVYFVRDNGAGFDMKYANKLFGAFERLHSPGEYEGHGIGLATVQRIVHRHGGHAWGEGRPGEGAIFYFTLSNGNGSGVNGI